MQTVYKFIYHPKVNQIWRNILKPFSQIAPSISKLPVSGVVTFKLQEGTSLKIATNPTSFATKHLFWEGIDSFEYIPIFKNLITKCESYYDIGANTGLYTILADALKPGIRVHAFEPSEGPYHFLEKNILLNNCKNAYPNKVALSDESGQVEFHEVVNFKYRFLKHNLGGVGNMAGKIAHRKMETNLVEARTADDYWKKEDGQKVDLVKIDTEATEDFILRGMGDLIKQNEPIIICETLFNKIEDKVETEMAKHPQYAFYNHVGNKLVKTETLKRTKDNGVRDCFFVPKSKIELIQEFL